MAERRWASLGGIDPTEGLDVTYRGETWSIWSLGDRDGHVWITRPDPTYDGTGWEAEHLQVPLDDIERIPANPVSPDHDQPLF